MVARRKSTPAVVKIKPETHATLREIAHDEDRSMGEIITSLVERYEHERFFRQAAEDLRRLREDPAEYQSYRAEADTLDQLASDGLEDEPPFFTEEEEDQIRAEIAAESQGR